MLKGLLFFGFWGFFVLALGLRGTWAELCEVCHCSTNSLAVPAHQTNCSSGAASPARALACRLICLCFSWGRAVLTA